MKVLTPFVKLGIQSLHDDFQLLHFMLVHLLFQLIYGVDVSENLASNAIQACKPDEALHEGGSGVRTVGVFVLKVRRKIFVVKRQRKLSVDVHIIDSEWSSQLDCQHPVQTIDTPPDERSHDNSISTSGAKRNAGVDRWAALTRLSFSSPCLSETSPMAVRTDEGRDLELCVLLGRRGAMPEAND